MKIKFTLLIALITTISVMGQQFEKLLYSKKDKPTIIINDTIIANLETIHTLPIFAVKGLTVMKSKENDQYAAAYPNLSQYGLILCEVNDPKIATKTQNDIRQFLGADSATKIYVDGFLIKNDKYLIATKSIKEIELINPNEQDLNENKIINIWTLTRDSRLGFGDLRKNVIENK